MAASKLICLQRCYETEKVVTVKQTRVWRNYLNSGSWGGTRKAGSCCLVEVRGPRLGSQAMPLFPSLLSLGKERNRKLDQKMRPELASGKPQSTGNHFLIAEASSSWEQSPAGPLKGRGHYTPSPTNPEWFLVCRIFHLTQSPSALNSHSQSTSPLLYLTRRSEQIIITLLKARR